VNLHIVEEDLSQNTLFPPEHCELCSSAAEEHPGGLVGLLKG